MFYRVHLAMNGIQIFESSVKQLTSNGQMMDQKFVYVVHIINTFGS
jgi:hypothetical protein